MALAHAPIESSLTGKTLSRRYLVKHEIGRGGMGTVYAAEPIGGGAPVAIKILHPYYVGDELVMTRFLEEGRTCMRLVHPNILRVHECLAAENGSPYLVMDLLEGIPLSAYTRDGGRVALQHAIPIFQGMLAGLEAAHAEGVVHRDLKPGNIFLARANGVFTVKLLDFGIAKVMDAAGGMGSKTSTGALLGTPAYMSPEQVKNAREVDARTDLWSVGVMFYELLTGRVAFPAPTEYARLAAVISSNPVPVQSIDAQLAPIGAFVDRALEKDRERRFQTATEMSAALVALGPAPTFLETGGQGAAPRDVDASPAAAAGPAEPRPGPSGWSLVADKTDTPGRIDPSPIATPRGANVLGAEVAQSPQQSTLASPKRSAGPSAASPSHPPPEVVIVRETARADAPAREVAPPVERGGLRVAVPWVAALVGVALAVGFAVGYFVGASG